MQDGNFSREDVNAVLITELEKRVNLMHQTSIKEVARADADLKERLHLMNNLQAKLDGQDKVFVSKNEFFWAVSLLITIVIAVAWGIR